MNNSIKNILNNLEIPKSGNEIFTTLLERKNIKVEFIYSNSFKNREAYKQDHDEWVVLLEGETTLELEGIEYELKKGDSIFIKASTTHRVLLTNEKTLWLAIHIF